MDLNSAIFHTLEWLVWLVRAGGVVVCAMNLRLSRGHLVVPLAHRLLLTPLLSEYGGGQSFINAVFLLSALDGVSSGLIVGGLAGMFHDLREHIRLLTHMAMDGRQPDGH